MSKTAKSKRKQEPSNPDVAAQTIEAPAAEGLPTFEQIQKRAYEIYLERGGATGSDVDDWLQAERELGGSAS